MKKFWQTVWDVTKVIGFLLLVAIGGWALWKYWLRNLFTIDATSTLNLDIKNPEEQADKKKAETIEERIHRLLNSSETNT